jgi:hypothetical protein
MRQIKDSEEIVDKQLKRLCHYGQIGADQDQSGLFAIRVLNLRFTLERDDV